MKPSTSLIPVQISLGTLTQCGVAAKSCSTISYPIIRDLFLWPYFHLSSLCTLSAPPQFTSCQGRQFISWAILPPPQRVKRLVLQSFTLCLHSDPQYTTVESVLTNRLLQHTKSSLFRYLHWKSTLDARLRFFCSQGNTVRATNGLLIVPEMHVLEILRDNWLLT